MLLSPQAQKPAEIEPETPIKLYPSHEPSNPKPPAQQKNKHWRNPRTLPQVAGVFLGLRERREPEEPDDRRGKDLPIISIVVLFWFNQFLYLGSYKVTPKRNYNGEYR